MPSPGSARSPSRASAHAGRSRARRRTGAPRARSPRKGRACSRGATRRTGFRAPGCPSPRSAPPLRRWCRPATSPRSPRAGTARARGAPRRAAPPRRSRAGRPPRARAPRPDRGPAGPVMQTTPLGRKAARRWSDAHTASIRSRGSSGPGRRGSGRIEGTSGTADVAPRPLASNSSSASSSGPSPSFSSQTPRPSRPARAYARTSSAKLAVRVLTCDREKRGGRSESLDTRESESCHAFDI